MSLSVAMICKDEERDILKCLKSVEPIADEYIIADTGSTDNTVDIIKGFANDTNVPVKIKFIDWEGNYFSGCRNYGLQFCTEPWVLWIDCDEWVYPESYDEIRSIVKRGDIYAAFAGLLSDLPDGRISKHYLPKFFRRDTAHFKGIVHNQLVHASPTLVTGIKIHHTGYNQTPEKMVKKRKRTANLLQKQIDKSQNNAFAYMNLSRTLMNDKKHKQAIAKAEKGLQYNSSPSCQQMLWYSVAVCAVQMEQYDKAESACWEALKINPENLDMTFALANVQLAQEKWECAILFLNRYLQLKEDEDVKPVRQQINFLITDFYEAREKAYNLLGICYNKIGKQSKAVEMHRQAVKCKGEPALFKNLAVAYEQHGELSEAYKVWYHMAELGYINDGIIQRLRQNPMRRAA